MNEQDIHKLIEQNEGYVSIIRELQQQDAGHVRQINTSKEGRRWFLEVWDKDPDCNCKQVHGRYCDWCEGIDKLNTIYTMLNGGIEYKK